jgi:hypothetical protein
VHHLVVAAIPLLLLLVLLGGALWVPGMVVVTLPWLPQPPPPLLPSH